MPDGEGWQVANWAWERRDEILQFLRRLRAWWKGEGLPAPAPGLLVLGPGGTGKTTLARLLTGDVDLLFDPPDGYLPSLGVERYAVAGKPAVEVVVPPGQLHRRGATWDDLLADLSAGRYRGVVLVTAYGHQSLDRDSYQQHPLYEGNKGRFLAAVQDRYRTEELDVLNLLLPAIRVAPGRVWLLTVVAKQDLWWPRRDEVERYYREGMYHAAAAGSFIGRGRRHEVCFASLVIQNLETRVGERLVPNAEGYDHSQQVASLRRLFETLDALREWEAGT